MVALESIVLLEAESGQTGRFEFPVNPQGFKIRRGRNVAVVPILKLGEIILPGSLVPVELSFETFLPRYYDPELCNYEYTERPEQSVERLERWMGRTKTGEQENPNVLQVIVAKTGFSRKMWLTDVGAESRVGEPDSVYISVTLKEWRRQVVRITQGTARPLIEVAEEATGGGGGGSASPALDDGALRSRFPGGTQQPAETGTPRGQVFARYHTVQAGDTLYSLAKRYYGDSGSVRLFADRLYAANAHKWRKGGQYYEKYAYFDKDGNRTNKVEFFSFRNFFTSVERRHLYQPPPERGRYYKALPPGVTITLLPPSGSEIRGSSTTPGIGR